jgi:hypothetical protein
MSFKKFQSSEDKAPANWVASVKTDKDITISISDKGVLMFRNTSDNKHHFCLQQSQVLLLAQIAEDLVRVAQSEEYKQVLENKEANKIVNKALEALIKAGIPRETALKMVKAA